MYHIDFIKKLDASISIMGWAFSIDCKTPVIMFIYYERDKVMNLNMNMQRSDVKKYFKKYEFDENCGFAYELDINYQDIKVIKFLDKDNNVEIIKKRKLDKYVNRISHPNRDSITEKANRVLRQVYRISYKIIFVDKFKPTKDDLKGYFYALKNAYGNYREKFSYNNWLEENALNKTDLDKQRKKCFKENPLISIITPTYNTKTKYLNQLIESLIKQTYRNWELCIADGSDKNKTREQIIYWQKQDSRVKVKLLKNNMGIVGNSNEACKLATGEFIGFLDHDDLLPENALYEIVKTINENPHVEYIYTDEDKITENGEKRFDPFFKPDWSPDALRAYNYLCHFSIIKKELIKKAGYFRSEFEGSQDYDLFLRITDLTKNIVHIPKILYHWRAISGSTALNPVEKPYVFEAAKKALMEHLLRNNLEGTIDICPKSLTYKIKYSLKDMPLVSILIPNKDHLEDLKKCLDSVMGKTTYKNYEIIVIENNSLSKEIHEYYQRLLKYPNINVITWQGNFNFSAINNFGVRHTKGDYLIFMNNDIEIITPNWIEELLAYNQRDDVGIVGCKLYFDNDTIQHAGVLIGINESAGHAHRNFPRESVGYANRLIIPHNLSAVTAACMMTKRSVFDMVNGFEERFAIAFNDVDYCLKIRNLGYNIVFNPNVEMYHYESKSRGYDNTNEKMIQFQNEKKLLNKIWCKYMGNGDPYYNPNFSLYAEDFSLKRKEIE